jgi:hydrogenase maturation protease
MNRTLVYGYGNPGRQDDGLGILLAEKWEEWARAYGIDHIDFEYNYQLNIEDAHTISRYERVIFVDASVEDIQDIKLAKVVPTEKTEFTMHAMYPGFILHLCQSLYSKSPDTFLLSIKGYEFEFMEALTDRAGKNLEMAFDLAVEMFSVPNIAEVMVNLENMKTEKTPL